MIQAVQADGTILEFPDGTPDSVIDQAVQEYIGGLPKPEYVYPYDARDKASFFGRVGESFESGVSQLGGLSASAVETAGELTGSEDLTRFGREGREAWDKREQEREIPAIQFTDIRNLGDVGSWLTDTFPEQTVMFAPSLTGGLAGIRVGALAGGALGSSFLGIGALPGTVIGATIGGLLGAFIPSEVLGVGEMQHAIKSKDPSAVEPVVSILGGTAIAALDTLLPMKIGSQIVKRFGVDIAENVAKRALLKPVKREYLKAAGKGMAVEGITEALQEAIAEVTAVKVTGQELDGAELAKMMINAGAAGALMGGTFRAGAERLKKIPTKEEERSQTEERKEDKAFNPNAPLLLTYQGEEVEFTTDSPAQVVQNIIDELVRGQGTTGVEEDIGAGLPLGPFTVRPIPRGGFVVVNSVGEVRTPIFQTISQAQEAAELLTENIPVAIEQAEAEFTENAAREALKENEIAESAATLAAAKETVTPVGLFTREEVGSKVADMLDTQRLAKTAMAPGTTVTNDGLYTLEEIGRLSEVNPETGAEVGSVTTRFLSDLVSKKNPLLADPELNRTVRDIRNLAFAKNIRYADKAFKTFALRVTGISSAERMSQVQRNTLYNKLEGMPDFEQQKSVPVIKFPFFTSSQMNEVIEKIRRDPGSLTAKQIEAGESEIYVPGKPIPRKKVTNKAIVDALGRPNLRGEERKDVIAAVRKELVRRKVVNEDGFLNRRVQIVPQIERVAPISVKKQELLQRLKPLARAINERFEARIKSNPALAHVRLKFNNVIEDIETGVADPTAEGSYATETEAGQFLKTIRLALDPLIDPSKSDQENIEALSEIFDHEFVHAAWDAGVITDQDKVALEKFVKKAKRPGTDQTYYEEQKNLLNKTPDETVVEESIAEAFRDWAAGRRVVPPKTRGIFRKIAEFFKLIKQVTLDADIITGNEIFQRLDAGVASTPSPALRSARTTAAPVADVTGQATSKGVPDFIEPPPSEQKFSRKRSRAVPLPVGENPFPVPPSVEVEDRLRRKSKRTDTVDAVVSTGPRNQRQEILNEQGDVVSVIGQITFNDWINKTEAILSDSEIAEARNWYPEAAKAYQKYFGKNWASYFAAWLMANQQASPATAGMNSVRAREQTISESIEGTGPRPGLAEDKLIDFWTAMEAEGQIPSGGAQKLYDFIDSGLLRETRTWMGDDVRGGSPAVADVHSLRDTGFVDSTYQKFLKDNYNVSVNTDTSGSPNENQYERSGDFMRALSDHLNEINYRGGGWTPYQVQSVGWMGMTSFLGKPGQTAEESILFNFRNLPYEIDFGEGSPFSTEFASYYTLPTIGQKEVTQKNAEVAADFARDITGVTEISRFHATGGWMDDTPNPNMVEQAVASPEAMVDMASIIGYLLEQTAMLTYRVLPKQTTKSKFALKIRPSDVSKDLLNNDANMAILWDKLRLAGLAKSKKAAKQLEKDKALFQKAEMEGIVDPLVGTDVRLPPDDSLLQGFTPTIDENGNTAMLILLDGKGKTLLSRIEEGGDAHTALRNISEEMGIDLVGETVFYESDLIENKWTEDQTGGVYIQRINQRYGPAVTEGVRDFKRSKLIPLIEDSITSARLKYGHGQKFSRKYPDGAVESRIPDRRGLSGSERRLQAQDRSGATAQEEVRVEGLPATYNIPGVGPVPTEPFAPARQAARDYGEVVGRSIPELVGEESSYIYGPLDGERATRIAQSYEDMPHTPNDAFTKKAYEALAEEVSAQYDFIKGTGLEIEFLPPDGVDPYAASPRLMIEDVKNNNHMYIFPTDSGYGDVVGMKGITQEEINENPLLRLTDEYISGRPARVNDLLRVVHDYFGHVREGFGFRSSGEEAAYVSHSGMFSPLARAALATETRGQNTWINYGPNAQTNRTASGADTVYAPQKIGILPEFAINEGLEGIVEPVNIEQLKDDTLSATQGYFIPDQKFARHFPQNPRDNSPNRFVKRVGVDGKSSENWGILKTKDGQRLNVRMVAGKNYEDGGGYGRVHAALHDSEFRSMPDLPFTTANAAIVAALDAYRQAVASGVGLSAFKITEGRRPGGQDMVWTPEGSKTGVKIVFDEVTSKGQGVFFGITTAYPESGVLRDDYHHKDVVKYRKANHLGPEFSKLSNTAQETVLTFKTRKPTGRPVLKLSKKAKQKFSRGSRVNEETPAVQETIKKTQVINEEKTAGQAVLGAIFGDYKDSVLFSNNWEFISSKFRKGFLDKYQAMSVLAAKASKVTGQLLADSNAYNAVLMSEQHAQVTKDAFFDGVPVYDREGDSKGYTRVAKDINGQPVRGLYRILERVLEERLVPAFGAYAMARRAGRINEQGKISGMTDEDIVNGLSLGEKYEYFSEVFEEYQVWNSYLVKYMVDTGLITPEMGQGWIETYDYTPYYRQNQESSDAPQNMTFFYPGDPTLGPLGQKMESTKGEKRKLIPLDGQRPSEELVGAGRAFEIEVDGQPQPEVYDSYNKAITRVRALRASNSNLQIKVFSAPRKVDDFLDNVTRNVATAIQGGMKNVAAQRVVRDSLILGIASDVTNLEAKPTDTIQIRVDGIDRYFEITDPFLYTGMVAMSQNRDDVLDNLFVGYAATPARVLRELVTRDPGFMLRNMLRDTTSAWVTSGQDYIPVIDSFRGVVDVMRGSTSSEALRLAGVFGGYDFAGTPKDMAKYIRRRIKTKYPSGVSEKAISPFKQLWDATTVATNASEAATRVAVYKRVLEKTGNEAQAVFEALEVLNFGRRGSMKAVRFLTAVIPFLNARMQGLDVLYRAGFNKQTANPNATKKAFFAKASFIIGVSALYTMLMDDEECYKNATPEARDLNWFVPTPFGGPCVKIPTPFEVGFLFKTFPERIMQWTSGTDIGSDVWGSVIRNLKSTFQIDLPQFMKPAYEVYSNWSSFSGREIIPHYMDSLDADYQVFQSTSSLAKKIGQDLNISPLQIDHLIKGYTGTLGSYALSLASEMVDLFQPADQPLPPNKAWYNLPMIRSFLQDPNSRGTILQFYQLDQAVRQAVNTLAKAESIGDTKKITEIQNERANLLALEDTMKEIRNKLKRIRETKNEILRTPMDQNDKKKLLDAIVIQELAVTETIPIIRKMGMQ